MYLTLTFIIVFFSLILFNRIVIGEIDNSAIFQQKTWQIANFHRMSIVSEEYISAKGLKVDRAYYSQGYKFLED